MRFPIFPVPGSPAIPVVLTRPYSGACRNMGTRALQPNPAEERN
jgi:hypothetical protein